MLVFLAVSLVITTCPPQINAGEARGCIIDRVNDRYPDYATCEAVVLRRYADGQWVQDAQDFQVKPGWTIEIDCTPMIEFEAPPAP